MSAAVTSATVESAPSREAFWRRPVAKYAIKRVGLFFLVVWAAATLIFFLPRLAPGQDPVLLKLSGLAASGGSISGMDEMLATYNERFGLNQPLWKQYLRYIWDYTHLDLGYSIASYPAEVTDLISSALPWTVGLLVTSTLISFLIGTLTGALLGWGKTPAWVGHAFTPLLTLSAIPYYLLGLVLIYFFAFRNPIFPLSGGYTIGAQPEWSWEFFKDAINHAVLPATSIILAQLGFWSLGMRGMMVMTEGEDYMTYAEAKGFRNRTIFFRYGLRSVLLPQTTSLALALGGIVSQAVLVEVVFGYPGIGTLLYRAISGFDYPLIYGIVFIVILTIGIATLIIDLAYPLLDPRITYTKQ